MTKHLHEFIPDKRPDWDGVVCRCGFYVPKNFVHLTEVQTRAINKLLTRNRRQAHAQKTSQQEHKISMLQRQLQIAQQFLIYLNENKP
jgi:hypothetical protein